MRFRVRHQTLYEYPIPVSESVGELRVWPAERHDQQVDSRSLSINPSVPIESYEDFFGNHVEFFAIPQRHEKLEVIAEAEIDSRAQPEYEEARQTMVGEARQIFRRKYLDWYPFLEASQRIPSGTSLDSVGRPFFRPGQTIGEAALELNHWIFENFEYKPGSTTVATPVEQILKKRQGVCQDFAHLMIAICRAHRIPARYVSGYIEPFDPTRPGQELIGAAASHAWVEVLLPGGNWWGLDPTNDQIVGERHVQVAVGRDYHDAAPLRGTFRGQTGRDPLVAVEVTRI